MIDSDFFCEITRDLLRKVTSINRIVKKNKNRIFLFKEIYKIKEYKKTIFTFLRYCYIIKPLVNDQMIFFLVLKRFSGSESWFLCMLRKKAFC